MWIYIINFLIIQGAYYLPFAYLPLLQCCYFALGHCQTCVWHHNIVLTLYKFHTIYEWMTQWYNILFHFSLFSIKTYNCNPLYQSGLLVGGTKGSWARNPSTRVRFTIICMHVRADNSLRVQEIPCTCSFYRIYKMFLHMQEITCMYKNILHVQIIFCTCEYICMCKEISCM